MSPIEHYFENLLTMGKDCNGDPNKNALSKEVQEAVEECASYISFGKLSGNPLLEEIKAEIEQIKAAMDQDIVFHDRKDLTHYIYDLEQCLDSFNVYISK